MSEQKRLYKEYERKLRILQRACPHKRLSTWTIALDDMLQATGYEVRNCRWCGKQAKRQKLKLVERRTPLRMIPLQAMKSTKIVKVKQIKEYIMEKRKRKGQ